MSCLVELRTLRPPASHSSTFSKDSMNLCTEDLTNTKEMQNPTPTRQFAGEGTPTPLPDNHRPVVTTILVLAAAVALGLGSWTLSRRLALQISGQTSPKSTYVASFPERSIAVLPFEDLTEPKPKLSVADSVQDDILTALSKVADLRVISYTSVSAYTPNEPRNLRNIAQGLGSAYILEGRVQQVEGKALITVQLTDARRNAKLWTESFTRDLG